VLRKRIQLYPVKIVNGKLFPNESTSPKYFINEFSDEKDAIKIESLVWL
jgi:hypothetical protein